MLEYITSTEYKELLGVDAPSDFTKLVIDASYYINQKTFGRLTGEIPEEVKYACALIVELESEHETLLSKIAGLKSQNIEGWSETYSTPEELEQDFENKKLNILNQYLNGLVDENGTPLLFVGVDTIG